jgi:hypothetical protein
VLSPLFGNRHAARGQAVTETAIMAPLFLLGLFGVFWSIRDATLAERVQLGVRYAGVSQLQANPYAAFSLYSTYAAIDNDSPPGGIACINGNAAVVTGDPYNGSAQLGAFWRPLATPVPLITPCPASGSGSLEIATGAGYSQGFLLPNDFITLQAQAQTAGGWFANAVFGGAAGTTTVATENFFHSPDVGTIVRCSTLGAVVKASLEAPVSTTVSYSGSGPVSTPMPATVPTNVVVPVGTAATCANPNQVLFASPVSPY